MPPTPPLGASPGFFCSGSGFWLVQACFACLLACLLACLFVRCICGMRLEYSSLLTWAWQFLFQNGGPQKRRFPRFSRPHSFVHSEHQPKECAGSRKEKERNRARTRLPTASTNQRSAPGSRKEEKRPDGRAVTELQTAFPGRTRLPTASTNQRSAPAADRKKTGRTGWP